METLVSAHEPDVIVEALNKAGLDGKALVARADDPQVKAALVAQTEKAVARGVFGVPFYIVGDEMFWGQDRLDDLAAHLGTL